MRAADPERGSPRRAFRRPVPENDADDRHADGVLRVRARRCAASTTGIQYALARVLVDPQFIFRFETRAGRPAPPARSTASAISSSRRGLSFFLWSSIPDEELLRPGRRRPARRSRGARAADAPDARRSARRRARRQPRRRSGCCCGSSTTVVARDQGVRRQPALRVPARDGAPLRDHPPRGPQRPRSDRRRLHVRRRAAGATLRHPEHPRQPLPARRRWTTTRGAACSGRAAS